MKYTKDQLAAVANFYKERLQNPPPEMRNILLYLAKDAFNNDIENSVYFQTQVLCNTFDSKNIFKSNSLDLYNNGFLKDVTFPKHTTTRSNSNPLLNFAKENFLNNTIEFSSQDFEIDFNLKGRIVDLKNLLKEMPREWTILQITRDYNEKMSLQSKEKNLTSRLPIYLSILKHARSSLDENFICIKMECNDFDIYCKFFEIQEMFKGLSRENLNEETKMEYYKKILPLENEIINAIEILEREFGPWSSLFSGNLENEEIQLEIFKSVDNFCKKNKLDNNFKIILSLLLSEPKKLNSVNCKIASEYLCKGKSKKLNNIVEEYLNKTITELLNSETIKKMQSRRPCLIIVDELLDHFPWEFLNKSQEFCRVSSLNILKQIFLKYKSKIINGYLEVKVEKGHFLVNPENNLKDSENRIRSFGHYWLPKFDFIYGEKPTHDKIKEIFNSHGIYVYCGHGHGMDYLNPHKLGISEIMNPVAFLFGCESVKLSMKTNYGEMIGEHLYFHKGLCPAVIGCIHIAFDYSLDLIAAEILSTWISSKQKTHWSNIDKELWRKGKVIPSKKISSKQSYYDSRLAAILSKIREKGSQKYYHLIPLVYRGIPIWNIEVNNSQNL